DLGRLRSDHQTEREQQGEATDQQRQGLAHRYERLGRRPGLAPDPAGALTGSAAAARTPAQTGRTALATGRANRPERARPTRTHRRAGATGARNRRSTQGRPRIAGAITAEAVVGAVARQHPTIVPRPWPQQEVGMSPEVGTARSHGLKG